MEKRLSDYISAYKVQLESGDIKIAYERLIKYMMALKADCEKEFSGRYSFGTVSPGYMDFTYFSFFDAFLRDKKLRFGIVLNHKKMRFELWLMGQNADVQKRYWGLLKSSVWNKNQPVMPRYSVLETVLVEEPDFDNLDKLTKEIEAKAGAFSGEILTYIKDF